MATTIMIFEFLKYFALSLFAFIPSLLWLGFFLKEDSHPEPKKKIIKIFIWGALVTIPAILLEWGTDKLINTFQFATSSFLAMMNIAFIEEFLKYSVIKKFVIKSPEFDEPIDTMMYMIVAALGFAAIENILILFSLTPGLPINALLINEFADVLLLRFIGATFLHALCSALVGYFLALKLFHIKNGRLLIVTGLFTATLLHAFYNFYIISQEARNSFIVIFILIVIVYWCLKHLKKFQLKTI